MKMKIIAYCLLPIAYFFSSCSSGTKENTENKTTSDSTTATVDTALHGLAGVIEAKPPIQNGDYEAKYPNGIVKMRGFYIRGKRNGQWSCFFENGNLQSEGFYKDGLRDGKATVHYENGQIYYTGFYKDGKEVGKWLFYDQQGKQINEKDYSPLP
jgi:antitoxin component YwqK of YwqJK toxin-antitoxin module